MSSWMIRCAGIVLGIVSVGFAGLRRYDEPSLLVASHRTGVSQLVRIDASGAGEHELTYAGGAHTAAWAPDGKRIAFVSGAPSHIFVMNADGSGVVQLTDGASGDTFPSWFPDGRRIVFQSDRSGDQEIYVMDVDGANVKNLTNSPEAWDADPTVSPDGSKIVFASTRSAGEFHVWVMNADGSNPQEVLPRNAGGWVFPTWSPDSRQILFSARHDDGSWQVFVVNADGKGLEKLTAESGWNVYAAWSSDNRYFAYVHFDTQPEQAIGKGQLRIIDTLDGSRAKASERDWKCGARPAWRPAAK